MTTNTAPSLAQALIRDFQAELPKTQRVLQAIPEDKFDWRPHDKSMTLRELAAHVAECPTWLDPILESNEMNFADIEDSYQPFAPQSHAELMEAVDKNAKDFCEALKDRKDDFLLEDWSMRSGDNHIMTEPREVVIRSIMLHHNAHHRGQITVYLRLLDIPVPPTYGSTADVSMF